MKLNRSELSKSIKRNIKYNEENLGRTCRTTWSHENYHGEIWLYGSFCKNYDCLIVTIGYFNNAMGKFLSVSLS